MLINATPSLGCASVSNNGAEAHLHPPQVMGCNEHIAERAFDECDIGSHHVFYQLNLPAVTNACSGLAALTCSSIDDARRRLTSRLRPKAGVMACLGTETTLRRLGTNVALRMSGHTKRVGQAPKTEQG